jgi:hypothetical protein
MENPIQFVPNIPVELGSLEPLLGRQHIVVLRVTGAGGVEKSN